jgi:hypothetical protein
MTSFTVLHYAGKWPYSCLPVPAGHDKMVKQVLVWCPSQCLLSKKIKDLGVFSTSYDAVMGIYTYTNVKCHVLWTATTKETCLFPVTCTWCLKSKTYLVVLFIQDVNKWCISTFLVLSADTLACYAWHKQKRLSTEALPCFFLRPTFPLTEMCFVKYLLCTPLQSVTSPS